MMRARSPHEICESNCISKSPYISMVSDDRACDSTFFIVLLFSDRNTSFSLFIHRVIMEHILVTDNYIRNYRNLECQRWL